MRFADIPEPPVPAYQNVTEFGHLWEFLEHRAPTNVLEIGSLYGGTLWYWSHLPTIKRLVAVDLPSDWAQVRDGVREARTHWADWFAHLDFHDLQADSHQPELVEQVRGLLDGDLFDVAFIDGDHTYRGVKRDFELWSPLVKPGGIVAFHDTIQNGDRHEPGVVKFTGELLWEHPSIEFFDPDGVGICAFII